MATTLADLSYRSVEQVGGRTTGSRTGRTALLTLVMFAAFAAPAAAQKVGCKDGPLAFIAAIYNLITMGAGTIIVSMVVVAGVLKMIPMRGTNSWGNALVGSVLIGILFLVVGPALVDLANAATPIQLNAQCK